MADIFQEVQDDLRRDRFKAFWDRFGTPIVVVAVIVVAVVGGWRGWQYYEAGQAAAAGDRYAAAARLAEEGKTAEARAAFAAIATDGPAGYRTLSRLREADEAAEGDKPAAFKLYQAIANDSSADAQLRDAARIRGAYLGVDAVSRDEVRALAEPLAAANGPWATLAREAIGLAAYKAGDMADARKQFEAVVADPEAPGSSRQRADLMLAVLPPSAAAGGDAPKSAEPKPAN